MTPSTKINPDVVRLYVAKAIRARRKAKRLTVAELARRIDITEGSQFRREAGSVEFRISDLVAYADALGCRIAKFLPPA